MQCKDKICIGKFYETLVELASQTGNEHLIESIYVDLNKFQEAGDLAAKKGSFKAAAEFYHKCKNLTAEVSCLVKSGRAQEGFQRLVAAGKIMKAKVFHNKYLRK